MAEHGKANNQTRLAEQMAERAREYEQRAKMIQQLLERDVAAAADSAPEQENA